MAMELTIELGKQDWFNFQSWTLVKKIERKDGVIMVFLDTAFAFVFPERQLDDAELVYRYLNECHKTDSSDVHTLAG